MFNGFSVKETHDRMLAQDEGGRAMADAILYNLEG
jgi:hypothetical protein